MVEKQSSVVRCLPGAWDKLKKLASYLMDITPQCLAKSKQSGKRCKNFASKGKSVCRIHGGRSTGARTDAGKARQERASWKHGLRSKEAVDESRFFREWVKKCSESIRGEMISR